MKNLSSPSVYSGGNWNKLAFRKENRLIVLLFVYKIYRDFELILCGNKGYEEKHLWLQFLITLLIWGGFSTSWNKKKNDSF